MPDELLAHISPARSENVNFFGVITGDVEAELAKLTRRMAAPSPCRPGPEHAAVTGLSFEW